MTRLPRLSAREIQVMQLLVDGHTNQAIAERLIVGVKSVESYRARLMAKLGLKTRAEIIQYASTTGILSQPNLAEGPLGHPA